MIGRGEMGVVGSSGLRHVAGEAIVVAIAFQADLLREATAPIRVAFEATPSIVRRFLRGRRQDMRIVAGDASEPTLAGKKATAIVHLLDLAAEPVVGRTCRGHERRPEPIERQCRPIVFAPEPRMDRASPADQMALFADTLAEHRLQPRGVDDRQIVARARPVRREWSSPGPWHRSHADRVSMEDRLAISVHRTGDALDAIRVAEEAVRRIGRLKWRFLSS